MCFYECLDMEKLNSKKIFIIDGSLAAELKKFNYDFEVLFNNF